jgi:predicted metal-dependent hydrolase
MSDTSVQGQAGSADQGTGAADGKAGGSPVGNSGGGNGAPPAPAPTGEPKETNSQQWAALVRKEQALTKQASELKALEASLKEQQGKLAPLMDTFEKHKDNPQELLRALGIPLSGAQPEKPTTVEDRIAKLEAMIVERDQKLAEREAEVGEKARQTQLEAMQTKYIGDLRAHVEKSGEKFELVKTLNAHALALSVQQTHWANAGGVGEPLTMDESLGMVESYLREEYADKLYGTSYLKGKFKPVDVPGETPPPKPVPGATTVSNNSPGTPEEQHVPLTADERWNKIVEKRFGPKPAPPRAKPKGK